MVSTKPARYAAPPAAATSAYDHFRHWGMDIVPAPVDHDGVDVDAWVDQRCDAVLVTPAHQFPLGTVLSGARRRRLADWAESTGALVIEDDYDAEQRYDRVPVAALQPLAPHLVAQTGSVSKALAPALRLGWLVPPPALREQLVREKFFSDLCSSGLHQQVLARMLAAGDYERHLRTVRTRRRRRRDALLAALATHVPDARVGGVAAGLHVTLTFPTRPRLDDRALSQRLLRAGVGVRPLSAHRLAPGDPGLVVGYAASSPARLEEGVRRIAAALSEG